jgi:hypothetical protein
MQPGQTQLREVLQAAGFSSWASTPLNLVVAARG